LSTQSQNEFEPIVHGLKLLRAEFAELWLQGPRFIVVHRFWQPETVCTYGEAIADARLLHRGKAFSLGLSTRPLLLFDYLARHMCLPQSASQIVAGISVDPFCQQHGYHADLHENINKKLSRNAIKQQVVRLRAALRSAFRDAGLNIDPDRVLTAEEIAGNEVRYRLKASVEWQHIEF
jgi:hypothetical protein